MLVFSNEFGIGPSHDFSIEYSTPLTFKQDFSGKVLNRLSFVKLSTWNSYYNITSNNNVLRYYNGTSYNTVTLPEGNYAMTDIIKEFEQGMKDNGDYDNSDPLNPIYYIKINENYNTGKLELDISNNYTLDCQLSNNPKSPNVILGANDAEYNSSQVLPNQADIMNGVNQLLIHCSLVAGSSYLGGCKSDVIYSFNIRERPSGPIYREANFPLWIDITERTTNEVKIYLTDQNNRLIDLHGEGFTVTCLMK